MAAEKGGGAKLKERRATWASKTAVIFTSRMKEAWT